MKKQKVKGDIMEKKVPLVEHSMSQDVLSIGPDQSLDEALTIILKNNINRLPVVDGGKLVGILSNRDIRIQTGVPHINKKDNKEKLKWMEGAKDIITNTKVSEVMTKQVQTCLKTDTVVGAAKLMRVGAVSSLVVVDSDETNRVIGVITRSDLIDELIRTLEPAIK